MDDDIAAHQRSLPIFPHKDCIQSRVRAHTGVVLVGEPGSGKTTQVTQYLSEMDEFQQGVIGCTQPRRVAAVTVARRVAVEMDCQLGEQVGYSVRFDDRTSQGTRIKYLTDGMLVQESLSDPLLSKYSVIIVDEAHERSLQTDTVLGLLKKIQRVREARLHVVVMSATLDCREILEFFPAAKCLYVRGRQFPVEIFHVDTPEESYLDAVLHCTLQIHLDEEDGDILVFLTGEEEIESMATLIRTSFAKLDPNQRRRQLSVLTIYAAMPPDKQMKVFDAAPENVRTVILATNIAETSVTIPGIRYVVDSGVVKQRFYNAKSAIDSLQVVPVSKSQAKQRSGRAGRLAPGKAFRLYTGKAYDALEEFAKPEIARANLMEVVLKLKASGVDDVLSFEFLSPPPKHALLRSLQLLYALSALDSDGRLTERVGKAMSRLPLEPPLARILIAAAELGGSAEGALAALKEERSLECSKAMLSIVAMISATNIFYESRDPDEDVRGARDKFVSPLGDHLTLLNVFEAYLGVRSRDRKAWCRRHLINSRSMMRAADIRSQLQSRCRDMDLLSDEGMQTDPNAVRKSLVAGLFFNAARRQDAGSYRMLASGQELRIHPSSVLSSRKEEYIVITEIIQTNKVYARQVSAIDPAWLSEMAPVAFQSLSQDS